MKEYIGISVNEPYPFELAHGEGAISDFLRPSTNRLLITMPDISNDEAKILKKGEIRGAVLAKNGAILFLWQFREKGKPSIILDSPFDARIIPDIQLYNIENKKTRLNIDVHIVDSSSKQIRGLRSISMSPGMTIEFLSAVQDQLSSSSSGEQQYQHWMSSELRDLVKQGRMWLMGQ